MSGTPRHETRRHRKAAIEKRRGLALADNGYRGIGIPDCIHSGEMAVDAVLKK